MHILWSLMTRRVTGVSLRHPERYREMFHIARKNRLHRAARELLSAYLQQIVVDDSFHCDPHPGNTLIMETGQLALLDFGMIGRFDMEEKDTIILLLLAFAERQGRRVAEIYLDMLDLFHTPDRRLSPRMWKVWSAVTMT